MFASFIDDLQVALFYRLFENEISDVSTLGAALAANTKLTKLE